MPRVLLVEDTPDIALWLAAALRQSGLTVEIAANGAHALAQLMPGHGWDAVLLDLQLPDVDGLGVLEQLRQRGDTVPVLVLTARASVPDRVLGLNLGADDYLPKPFEPRELLARVKALLRRASPAATAGGDEVLEFGRLAIDLGARQARLDERPCELTSHQFDLLVVLARAAGRVLSRDQIMDALKGHALEAFDRSIDVHVSRIRAAIEDDPRHPRRLLTVRGAGYVFARRQDG